MDFKSLIIPDTVWREVEYHRPTVFKHKDVNFEKVSVVLDDDILSVCRLFCLDSGEIRSTPCTPARGGHSLGRSIPDFLLTNCTLYHKYPACGILPLSWKLELLSFPSPC